MQPERSDSDSPAERSSRETSRLGRGLAALIGEGGSEAQAVERARSHRRVPIEFLSPNPRNPRRSYGEAELGELAASIREKGIVQPILARPVDDAFERFEIIAGERRWRAAQRAGLHEVPVVVQRVDDRGALELAIIENVQRADLNALEEAAGYQQLVDEFGHSQEQLSGIVGKSRSHVANTLRLLGLPEPVKAYLRDGRLSAGHARTLVGRDDAVVMARDIVEKGLTVREAESLGRAQGKGTGRIPAPSKDADTRALEQRLASALGIAVDIRHRPHGVGELRLRYGDLEQLDMLTSRLLRS